MIVTINDVAKEAGVSITTVSRVVNNNYPVKKETREKIEAAIKKLNYKPNAMARGLVTKKTSMVSVVVPGITNLFFPTIVEAIEEYTKKRGYSISLCNTGGEYNIEKSLIDNMIARQVDGIIAIDPSVENFKNKYFDEVAEIIPLVIINGAPNSYKCNFVCYDEEVGTREALDYLISLNHRKIAFIRGTKSFSYDIKEKVYKETLRDNNIEYEKTINVGHGNSIEVVENTQLKLKDVLNKEDRPTAMFACNDLMALGVMNVCNKLGLSVPEDVSVISCDNTLIANTSQPRLTSVDLHMEEIGKLAAEELLYLIEKEVSNKKKILLGTKLIVRESCTNVKDSL